MIDNENIGFNHKIDIILNLIDEIQLKLFFLTKFLQFILLLIKH